VPLQITAQENTDQYAELTDLPTITLAPWTPLEFSNSELVNALLLLEEKEEDNANSVPMFSCLLVEFTLRKTKTRN
jgi:hypothetical protein